MKQWIAVGVVVLGSSVAAAAPKDAAVDPKGIQFFEKSIRPVLVDQCYKCHSAKSAKVKGGLLLDTEQGLLAGGDSGPAVIPNQPAKSVLIEAIRHEGGLEMPPDKKLPEKVIADFEKWIRMGAPYPTEASENAARQINKEIDWKEARNFWSFQPIKSATPPTVKDKKWARDDVDRFVLARLEKEGLKPVADADRRTLIRRLSFDLIGLPPAPEEVDAFINDKSANAVEKLVDRLLASPNFGETWGRHWLDVARYAESNGNVDNTLFPHAWRYRDYVIAAFNRDKPFNEFITEQVAGDLLPADKPERRNEFLTATGFLALASKPRPQNNPDYVLDLVADQVEVTTTAFMALTVACARCHDHRFDPIPTAEYYQMAAIFESTTMLHGDGGRKMNNNKRPQGEVELHKLASVNAATAEADLQLAVTIAGLSKDVEEARTELGKLTASNTANDKSNKKAKKLQRLKEKGALNGNGDSKPSPEETTRIAELKDRIKKIDEQLAELEKKVPGPEGECMGVRDRKAPVAGKIRLRGESQKPGDAVPRGFVTVGYVGSPPEVDKSHSGRLELAQWIASRDNPLTSRVIVNRIWRHLFGNGIVRTVDNFGALGESPSHPELLDYLAGKFVDDGWSVKQMIRRIVLSHAYQLSSQHDAASNEKDPENILLWRHDARRLDAEAVRDALLAVGGHLDASPAVGSPVTSHGNAEVRNGNDRVFSQFEFKHRSIYLPMVRNAEPEILTTFDLPDTELVVGDRSVTTVPAQSLFLMNSRFVVEQAQGLSERVLASDGLSDTQRVDIAYHTALNRSPTAEEQLRALHFVTEYSPTDSGKKASSPNQAWKELCQALLASAEFRYVE
ncbi:MAG: DUF1553 domain-containing protein [Planctomycetales bacterium]|nr:DUF1553 domain-containing protein [Planctomycetales bacterium]